MLKLHLFRTRRILILSAFIVLVFLYILFVVLTRTFFTSQSIACYRIQQDALPNILDANPRKDKSIFFHETSCKSYDSNKIQIAARQACAVESAAVMNPDLDVYLLFTSPGLIHYEGSMSDRMLKALLTYKNIRLHHVDYEEYTKGTPVEDLYKDGKVESSSYPLSHASDLLRYITLWRYGGTYLDLDVIVIKSLEELGQNYAGSESDNNVAAGVLNFAATGKGHHFAELCLQDLKYNFRGYDWGYNGPGVITRLLRELCGVTKAKDMEHKSCQGFTVYPPEAFYVVAWPDWTMYFNSNYNNKLFNMTKDSYVIHVWNKDSINTKINVNSDVPYSLFAKKYCPKVFSECDEYF